MSRRIERRLVAPAAGRFIVAANKRKSQAGDKSSLKAKKVVAPARGCGMLASSS